MMTLSSIISVKSTLGPILGFFNPSLEFIATFCLFFLFFFFILFIHVCTLDLFAFMFIPLPTPRRKITLEIVLFLICIILKILQPGLAGINLGKFLIKRVVKLVKREMPHISVSILPIL